jgi:hypothetical protein
MSDNQSMCKTCDDLGYVLKDDGNSIECDECNSHRKIAELPRIQLFPVEKKQPMTAKEKRRIRNKQARERE